MSSVNTLRAVCRCGHDKTTHFKDAHACLGTFCDCRKYRDPEAPEESETLQSFPAAKPWNKPHDDYFCSCDGCVDWVLDQDWP